MTPEALVLQSSPIVTVGYIMQVLISLGIVVAMIFVSAKYLLPRLKMSGSSRIIQVVDRIMLEPQVSAYILKVGKKAWLVVTGSKSVAKIDSVEEELPI